MRLLYTALYLIELVIGIVLFMRGLEDIAVEFLYSNTTVSLEAVALGGLLMLYGAIVLLLAQIILLKWTNMETRVSNPNKLFKG